MKTIATEFAYFMRGRARQNLKVLLLYCLFLAAMVLAYAAIFRTLMWQLEGREFSLIAGIYWAITVMTTLGFGDITFHSDPGYIFATVVTLSGVLFLLIILPFGMISLFLAPWIEHRYRNRLSGELPPDTSGHVVIFGFDGITRAFVGKLMARNIPYVIVTADHDEALRLEEENLRVLCGVPTGQKILDAVKVDTARCVVANLRDPENATIALNIRSRCQTMIAAFADDLEHRDLMRQAGVNKAIALQNILGRYLAIRATTCGAMAHILETFGDLQIAEIPLYDSPFTGLTLQEARIRQRTGLAVIGIWERGHFSQPARDTRLNADALLVLAGTKEQLETLQQITGEHASDDLVFILGHGRIGCAAARFLERKPVPFILVDRDENPSCTEHIPIYGDATLRRVLASSGIDQARGLIITTNDDNTNIFLTLASRQLLPHVRLVARANCEESVDPLYQAGADFVVSSASVGASILVNILESKTSTFLTEGISIFRRTLPKILDGKTIVDSQLRPRTGCSIVAIETGGG
ncbi:MAG: potassium transporter TrkA, partial [Desulfuromonas sp.]